MAEHLEDGEPGQEAGEDDDDLLGVAGGVVEGHVPHRRRSQPRQQRAVVVGGEDVAWGAGGEEELKDGGDAVNDGAVVEVDGVLDGRVLVKDELVPILSQEVLQSNRLSDGLTLRGGGDVGRCVSFLRSHQYKVTREEERNSLGGEHDGDDSGDRTEFQLSASSSLYPDLIYKKTGSD